MRCQHIRMNREERGIACFTMRIGKAIKRKSKSKREVLRLRRKRWSGNDLIERMMEEWYRDHKQDYEDDRYIRRYRDRGAR